MYITFEDAQEICTKAQDVLRPRLPVASKDLFAGRWEQLQRLADAVRQPGLHVAIYGERGVDKTSLANIVKLTVWAFDGAERKHERLVIKASANSGENSVNLAELFADIFWDGR